MPTVTFDKRRVLSYTGEMSDDVLADRISMLGTDLDAITETDIIVEIFPNRPDMLSEEGFAHALANFVDKGSGFEDVRAQPSEYIVEVDPRMSSVRPYTVAAVVKGLSLSDESLRALIQLQEKLHISYGRKRAKAAIGLYPMEHISWPIRFTAQRPESIVFTPLDSERMDARSMLDRHPAGREYAHLLKGFPLFPVFRDADDNVLSVPPIINSEDTGRVTETTRDVFIEVSGFHMVTLEKTLAIIAFSMQKLGGQVFEVTVRYPDEDRVTPVRTPQRMSIDRTYVSRILGFVPDVTLLARMGLGYDEQADQALVPSYRTDVLHPIDIVEDLAIAYGYENFTSQLPSLDTIAAEDPLSIFERKLACIMIGFGLQETQTYHLVPAHSQRFIDADIVELANPMNAEYDTLRTTMLISLLEVLSRNQSAQMPRNIFEMGRVFLGGSEVSEHDELGVLLEEATLTDAQQIVDSVLSRFGFEYSFVDDSWWHSLFIEGRRAQVILRQHIVGEIGEVHPDVLRSFGIYQAVVAVRLNVEELSRLMS